MREIAFTREGPRADRAIATDTKPMFVRSKDTVWVGEDKVSVVNSLLLTGLVHKDSTKQWWRWHTYKSAGLKRTSAGNITAYLSKRDPGPPRGPWVNSRPKRLFDMLHGDVSVEDMELSNVFKANAAAYLGVNSIFDVYPFLENLGTDNYLAMPPTLLAAFRHSDPLEAASVAFGKARGADLATIVKDADPFALALAREFRGFVDDATLEHVARSRLEDEDIAASMKFKLGIRPFIRRLTERQATLMAKRGLDGHRIPFLDTLSRTSYMMWSNAHPVTITHHWEKYMDRSKDMVVLL